MEKKPRHWLMGARVWSDYSSGQRILYDFVGVDGMAGVFVFQERKGKHRKVGKTIQQLTTDTSFRPFLINFEKIGPGKFVVVED